MRPYYRTSNENIALIGHRKSSESSEPEVLADIYDSANNIAIWKRELNQAVLSSVDQLFAETRSLKIEGSVRPESAKAFLLDKLKGLAWAEPLSSEIAELVDMFCCLFELENAGLRLTMLDHAMCPRFHVDRVPCRLVTTFKGSSTQWLPHEAVDRSKLGHGNNGLPDEESGIYQDVSDIRQLTSGDVALLKGELWEGNENAGLVHRSPGVKPGEKRLLLTLDFIG
ncbi:DUF1826 domain-containing protein [Alkalimarinus coralli]|uniref:DUF1826 domain-containing protein n=1 Tax=Alkalimarinus coralli TaxID=2935863 RepID=UPI00202B819D|nr:DUF1826 domain-containing protein [Alkalimarinus coralli]